MKSNLKIFILLSLLSISWIRAFSQTGPGGVGNATGVNGHPLNLVWLDAVNTTISDDSVSVWSDKSGNLNHLTNSIFRPYYATGAINSLPAVRFVAANNTRLVKESFTSFPGPAYSVIFVYRTSSGSESYDAMLSYAITGQANEMLLFNNADMTTYIKGNVNTSGVSFQNGGNFQIATHKWRSSDGRLRLFQNGTQQYSTIFRSGDTIKSGGTLAVGGEQDGLNSGYQVSEAFDGDIAEMIVFSAYLNDAQRTIIENYLNLKYNITISNDFFAGNATYYHDFTGIGQEADGNFTSTVSAGVYLQSIGSLDAGDYIMYAHNNLLNAVSTDDLTGSVAARWARDWYFQQTGGQNVKITFDIPEGISGGLYPQNLNNYVLLYRSGTSGDYSVAATSSVAIGEPDQVVFTILGSNLPSGYYTLGTLDQANSPVQGTSTQTWYTLASGNWNDPTIWTLDPSGALPNNPQGKYPQIATEKVVIKTGKTVTMNLNSLTFASVTVEGRLDLGTTTGHNFGLIRGNGRIRMAADNFPAGNATHFTSAGQGEGTVVYYGASSDSLENARTFYNMEVEMTSGQTLTLLANYTVNGYLRIKSGTFKINDNTSTTGLTINVYGNMDILSGAMVSTGLANARHQLNLYGDLTNAGELWFTNRVAYDYNNEATNGIVDANFLHATKNQQITCNGPSNFYRIEIDKGTDNTYELFIVASDAANFKLYGYANHDHGSDDGTLDANNNALGLLKGTVRVGSNVNIPVLNNSGNYNIATAAQLWVDGGTVTKPNGTAIVVYGVAKVSAGTLSANVNSGFTFRDNGLIKVEGGELYANQIRNSVYGASNVGGYYQSSGTAYVGAGSTNTDYYIFNLSYVNNTFSMSGGTLHIRQANAMGGIFINSDPGNYNVSGGTVIFDIDNARNFIITSKAPFWDVIMRNSAANSNQHILADAVDVGTDNVDLAAQTLTVLNDLTIEAESEFNANGTDLEIGGDFIFEDGATYTHGNNTTRFIGNANSDISIENISGTAPLIFYNLEIEKAQRNNPALFWDVEVLSPGRTVGSVPLRILNNLLISRGEFNTYRFNIEMYGDTIEIIDGNIRANATNPGKITLTNSATTHTLKGAFGKEQSFGHIDLNNTNDVKLLSDINVTDFTFSVNNGLCVTDIYNIEVTGNVYNYSSSRYFLTAGNSSDGGLTLHFTLSGSYGANSLVQTFPVGTITGYTRGEIYIDNYDFDTPISGWMKVVPVNSYHPASTANPAQVLNYYWVSEQSGFDLIPADNAYYLFYYISNVNNAWVEHVLLDNEWIDGGPAINNSPVLRYDRATFGFINGDFACGNNGQFNNRRILYSRASGDWHTKSTWSLSPHGGAQPQLGGGDNLPQATDICVVGLGHRINATTAGFTIGRLEFNHDTTVSTGFEDIPRVQIDGNFTFNFGKVVGTGMFTQWIGTTGNPTVTGDFGEFANQKYSWYLFVAESDNVTLPATQSVFPNLATEGSGLHLIFTQDIVVNYNLNPRGRSILLLNTGANGNIYVGGNCYIGDWEQGKIKFPSTGTARKLTIMGNLDFTKVSAGTTASNYRELLVDNTTPSNLLHELIIGGDIIQGVGIIDLYNTGASANNTILKLIGENNKEFTRTGAEITELYRIQLNKIPGKDFTFSDYFTLNGPTNGTTKALELISGNLILNDTININLSTGGADFKIPADASLQANYATLNVSGNNTGIWLDGYMRVGYGSSWLLNQGTNNHIQYTASGNAEIAVYQGTLLVGSQIRRQLNTESGILNFRQEHSNSNVTIGTDASIPNNGRGIFELVNTGSQFKQVAGAKITLQNASANNPRPSLYINLDLDDNPLAADIDSTAIIQFGNLTTLANQSFTLYSNVELGDLVIDSTGLYSPKLSLSTLPLTLKGNLEILDAAEFDANGLDLTLKGDFVNYGSFVPNNNEVIFNGTKRQYIIGNVSFYDLTKNASDTLYLAPGSEIEVTHLLSLEDGIFNDNGANISVTGNLHNVVTTLSPGTGQGIIMQGTDLQTITGSGTYAKLTINNANGIEIPTGFTTTITDTLRLNTGVLDIGRNLLVLTQNAEIEEVSPFSETNMIQTNISFTDAGIRKFYPVITSSETFIYPIGSAGKYTPIKLVITENDNSTGSIRVRAADEMHVSIIEDSEAPNPEITDASNVLQYHWTLDANGIQGFSAVATMDSYAGDVRVTSPYTAADYITARLLDAGMGSWTKYDKLDFNEATNELYFYFSETDDLGIDGDYTAGIDDAIPDQVPSYITKQNGAWNEATTWDTYPVSGGDVPAGGPRGAIVYIKDTVDMPNNFMASYITNIMSTGNLIVGETYGHRLGIVNGTGKLYMERGDLPAGVYDGFFAPDSGTIEFSGMVTDYDILSEHTYVNNLVLTGTGERRFPNLNMSIYGNLILGDGTTDSTTVINEHNQTLYVYGNLDNKSGEFDAGFGDDAIVSLSGTRHQYIYGDFKYNPISGHNNTFNHLQINNPEGVSLSLSDVEIDNKLILSSGVIFTTDQNSLILKSLQEDIITGGSNASHVSGPLFKNINNGGAFNFPVGNLGRYGRVYVKNENALSGYWQAQYYNQNPGNAGFDPLSVTSPLTLVSNNEYWRIQGPTGSGDLAKIGLRWDAQSGMPTDAANYEDLRIAEWQDLTPDSWVQVDASNAISGAGTTGTITSTVNSTFNVWGAGNYFTLSSLYTPQSPEWEGDVSTAWHDPGNWSTNSIPTSLDDVTISTIITYEPTISTNAVCGTLAISTGRTLTINSTASLSLSGNLTMNGNISILSDANGTGSLLDNGTITGSGTAMVQRFVSGNLEYHYLSSPLAAVPNTILYNVPGEYPNPNFYAYNETVNNADWAYGWVHANTLLPGNMRIGRGYAYAFSRNYTFNFTGGSFNTGNLSHAVTNSNHLISSDGWNLVGNPYPSALSAYDFLTANAGVIDGTLYFWDDDASLGTGYSTEDYATWNLAGSVGTAASGGTKIPDGYISNGQAFFVHKTDGSPVSENLNFTNSMRRIGNGQFFKNTPVDETKRLRMSIANNDKTIYNQSLLVFIQEASDGFDQFYDAKKLKGNAKIAFYSLLDNTELAIQSFSPLDLRNRPVKVVPMGYKVTVSGNYNFILEGMENISSDMEVYLEDLQTGNMINLKINPSYNFTTSAGVFNSRFIIHFNLNGEPANEAPFLYAPLADFIATEDIGMNYVPGQKTFVDIDVNDKLTYSAKLSTGEALPGWLTVNPSTGEFAGTPGNDDVGVISIELTATDLAGASASGHFTLLVLNVNDEPVLNGKIPNQEVNQHTWYSYTLAQNLFIDIDAGDVLGLSAALSDGSPLPGWLSFDAVAGQFSGTASVPADISIVVTATDVAGASVSDSFVLSVKSTTGMDELSGVDLKISPNPTRGQFYIQAKDVSEILQYYIRDNSGKLLADGKVDHNNKKVDISTYASGIYFVEISDGSTSKIFKLVLQK